jgi:hypothetical protein
MEDLTIKKMAAAYLKNIIIKKEDILKELMQLEKHIVECQTLLDKEV